MVKPRNAHGFSRRQCYEKRSIFAAVFKLRPAVLRNRRQHPGTLHSSRRSVARSTRFRTAHGTSRRLRNECSFCGSKERNGVRPNEKLSWLRRDGVCNCPYHCSGWGQRLHQRSGGWRRCRTCCRSPRISRRGGRLRDWSSRSLEKREEESESEPAAIKNAACFIVLCARTGNDQPSYFLHPRTFIDLT
jgi:hypothetical protein